MTTKKHEEGIGECSDISLLPLRLCVSSIFCVMLNRYIVLRWDTSCLSISPAFVFSFSVFTASSEVRWLFHPRWHYASHLYKPVGRQGGQALQVSPFLVASDHSFTLIFCLNLAQRIPWSVQHFALPTQKFTCQTDPDLARFLPVLTEVLYFSSPCNSFYFTVWSH